MAKRHSEPDFEHLKRSLYLKIASERCPDNSTKVICRACRSAGKPHHVLFFDNLKKHLTNAAHKDTARSFKALQGLAIEEPLTHLGSKANEQDASLLMTQKASTSMQSKAQDPDLQQNQEKLGFFCILTHNYITDSR